MNRSGKYPRIWAERDQLIQSSLPWQERGLMETATGYGSKLTTIYKINVSGKLYRVYCALFSNAGTCFITLRGERIIIKA